MEISATTTKSRPSRWLLFLSVLHVLLWSNPTVTTTMAQGADDLAPDDFVAPVTDDPTQGAPDVNVTVTDDTKAATDDADQVGCFSTINGLALQEAGADTAERRIYQLCPNSVYGIGSLDYDNVLQAGQEPIPIRPNMHIKCGASGVLENSCVLNGGDVQLDGTSFFGVRNSDRIDNVTIEGVTFLDAHMYNVWLNKPGSVKFINCEFRANRKAIVPVFLDYFDPEATSEELAVTFQDCTFRDNVFGGQVPMDLALAGVNRYPTLIVGNSQQDRLIIENTVFVDNDMNTNNSEFQSNSFLVETSGPLTVRESCFENNRVGVSMVMSYNPEAFFYDNFGNESDGGTCAFAAHYATPEEYDSRLPQCSEFDASTCYAYGTRPPSMQPSSTPSWAPSNVPSSRPSDFPSGTPSTLAPTTKEEIGSRLTSSGAAHGWVASMSLQWGTLATAVLLVMH